mmetsp:Transcript_18190/g.43960  ORF Transcript_18190/g.43960 Transcript_18190/m.43960 type:complete len:372 (-) Transcript_18190:1165-2280(-)
MYNHPGRYRRKKNSREICGRNEDEKMRDEQSDEMYTEDKTRSVENPSGIVRNSSGTGTSVRLPSVEKKSPSRPNVTPTNQFNQSTHCFDFDELLGVHVVPMLQNDLQTLQALVMARPDLVARKFLTHEVVIRCAVNDLSKLNKLSRSLINLHRQGLTEEKPVLFQSQYSEKLDELLWDLKQSSGDIFVPSPSRLLRLLLSDECERCPLRKSPVDVEKKTGHVHFEFGVQICLDCSRSKRHLQEMNNRSRNRNKNIYDDDDEYGCYEGTRFYNRLQQYFGVDGNVRFMFKSPQYDIRTEEPIGPIITLEIPTDQIQQTLEDANSTCSETELKWVNKQNQQHDYQKDGSRLWMLYQHACSSLRRKQQGKCHTP